ncbi:DNA methyltransferase [Acidithiobacillus ferriphilus]|uniref:DNA methyltransferase n=1 Tax=Acidithiobacillus ferriphilus TaxID=1689834 RepID=UPI001C076B8B|nr:DNA methyltransferase [Acidithiobacillus ferriphilus]
MRHSLMNTFRFNVSFPSNVTLGTLYIASLAKETNFIDQFKNKCLRRILPFLSHKENQRPVVSTQSSTDLKQIETASVDYIFIDPPFGDNLAYSELNFSWEAWFGVFTKQANEAVVSKYQAKELSEYRSLMTGCFDEANRILKPGRWVTVEFSNTKASVWNTIQTALVEAGFIVANVSALDKKQGSFNAVTNTTSVKQDLVISAYKPNGGFEERFQKEAQTEEGVWDFVRTHLKYLPVTKRQGVLLLMVPERDPRILFDQMIAFYVRKGYPVPISSQEFQNGLSQRFIERDGMYFLPDQVAEYDRKKMTSGELKQVSMFVSDEASAIQWLRQLIKEKPQTFSDINPKFMQQLGGWSKNEAQLDLRELLNQNFLCYDSKGPVPEQIHAYRAMLESGVWARYNWLE